jgi:hypothetical protein
MQFKDIGRLTFPQAHQLCLQLQEVYREQRRETEAMKLQGAIRRLRGR